MIVASSDRVVITTNQNLRTGNCFEPLNLLFGDVVVFVAVAFCLSSLVSLRWRRARLETEFRFFLRINIDRTDFHAAEYANDLLKF